MRIDLVVDESIEEAFRVRFEIPNGWKITGRTEEMLEQAIENAIENAAWTDKGFVMKETDYR